MPTTTSSTAQAPTLFAVFHRYHLCLAFSCCLAHHSCRRFNL